MNGTQRRGPGKSMKSTFYVQRHGKRHSQAEAMSNNKTNVESEGISQSG